jgi:RNA polymerase sigma-70 factor (ECF subfamily)
MIKGADKNSSQLCSLSHLRALSDIELGTALLNGCNDALAILFERYHRLVFHIARNIVKDDGEAEETVQQVFFDLFRAIKQFQPERGSFKTWLLQFAYHRSINRRQHLLSNGFYHAGELTDALPAQVLDRTQRALPLETVETTHFISQILATLKPTQRRVIELTYFEGLTAEEIASKLGEKASNVRHSLYRGLSVLRHALLDASQAKERTVSRREKQQEGVFVRHAPTV